MKVRIIVSIIIAGMAFSTSPSAQSSKGKVEKIILPENLRPGKEKTPPVCLTRDERQLYRLINEYRKTKNLPPIPLSLSLTKVAQTHAEDSRKYSPHNGRCNMHSWSSNGNWSSCCYTSDHRQAKCMWDKPKELTDYTGNGFEISFRTSAASANPASALNSWKGSSGHNSVIINDGTWRKMKWQAIGIGMRGGYAHVWFGIKKDAAGEPAICP